MGGGKRKKSPAAGGGVKKSSSTSSSSAAEAGHRVGQPRTSLLLPTSAEAAVERSIRSTAARTAATAGGCLSRTSTATAGWVNEHGPQPLLLLRWWTVLSQSTTSTAAYRRFGDTNL